MSNDSNKNLEDLEQARDLIKDTDTKLKEIVNSNILSSISEIIKNAKDTLKRLDEEKLKLEEEKEKLENDTNVLQEEKQNLVKEREHLEQEKTQLQLETKRLEKEKADRDKKIDTISSEQQKLLEEYKVLQEDLKKFQEIASEAENAEFDFKEIQQVLKIYVILLEEIYETKPHIRILYLLHGDSPELHRKDIAAATGIGGAFVLRALHELNDAKLVEYDEETGMARLMKRMFPKSEKEPKRIEM
ncbi:MAG: hypothetical protein GF364_17755 [Candidatus Lokiarchaeota archaeon]|nr:hypothetical protein [Candidatus Lokiarchaeota archaeon]